MLTIQREREFEPTSSKAGAGTIGHFAARKPQSLSAENPIS